MAEIACFLALLIRLRSHKTFNQGNKYMEMCRTILCINIITYHYVVVIMYINVYTDHKFSNDSK